MKHFPEPPEFFGARVARVGKGRKEKRGDGSCWDRTKWGCGAACGGVTRWENVAGHVERAAWNSSRRVGGSDGEKENIYPNFFGRRTNTIPVVVIGVS